MPDDCDLIGALLFGSATNGNPYNTALIVCNFCVVVTFVVSTVSKNYSQVDKIWSIVPAVYAWIPVCDERTLLMAICATIWAVRLTWNFARRGGYQWPPWKGDEDYRWEEIQKGNLVKVLTKPVPWMLFNLGFISFYQNVLLLLIAYPSFVAYTAANDCETARHGLGLLDWVAAACFLACIVIEGIADNQQYAFQTEKYRQRNAGEPLTGDYADGFNQSGLFAIVRKPNYAAEQGIWISFYVFSVSAIGVNWSGIGWILLVLLFQGSGWFTESLTIPKYPKYKEYQQRVPLYLPNPFMKRDDTKKSK